MYINILIVLVGLLAGTLGSLLGLGGGVIMLPAMQIILHMNTTASIATTLFAVIFTSASGAWGHFRNDNVKWMEAVWIGAGGLIGVYGGSLVFKLYLSHSIRILELLLGFLFLFMAVRMTTDAYGEWKTKGSTGHPPLIKGKARIMGLLALGIFTGIFSGIMGLGGGFIMVPVMLWIFGSSPYQAVGTTLMAMFPIALAGGIIKLEQGFVDLRVGLLLGLGTIFGTQFGVALSNRVHPLWFKSLFAFIFLYLSYYYISPF